MTQILYTGTISARAGISWDGPMPPRLLLLLLVFLASTASSHGASPISQVTEFRLLLNEERFAHRAAGVTAFADHLGYLSRGLPFPFNVSVRSGIS